MDLQFKGYAKRIIPELLRENLFHKIVMKILEQKLIRMNGL
jgi:hypothetical protein